VVPGDPSAATFYLAALGVVPSGDVELEGMSLNPTRIHMLQVFRDMGVPVDVAPDPSSGEEPRGTVRARCATLRAISLGGKEIPPVIDELPALAVAAAFAQGTTRIRGAQELRVKESDRLRTVAEGLRAIGARVVLHEDGWDIEGSGGARLAGGEVRTEGDHRIGMAFLIAGLGCTGGVTLVDPPGITTSDPHFLGNLARLEGDA
jgi:3-phosphoshikimate 1-carboxyvinyltransferase